MRWVILILQMGKLSPVLNHMSDRREWPAFKTIPLIPKSVFLEIFHIALDSSGRLVTGSLLCGFGEKLNVSSLNRKQGPGPLTEKLNFNGDLMEKEVLHRRILSISEGY